MKNCRYCGRANEDDAFRCVACGTELVQLGPVETLPVWERLATLEHEIEADHLALVLRNKHIPHVIVSHADSAFDGLFQVTRGWGHVEAPPEHRDAILDILKDIRQSRSELEGSGPGSPG